MKVYNYLRNTHEFKNKQQQNNISAEKLKPKTYSNETSFDVHGLNEKNANYIKDLHKLVGME